MRNILLTALFLVAACREDAALVIPEAVTMNDDALGYYCQMNLAEHDGPKGQVHLEGQDAPIFFGQVRDTIAYLNEPERVARIMAIYVSDMSNAASWAEPGADNWVLADQAWFVLGSDALGGMGAPEIVPFGSKDDALDFAAKQGGEVMRLADVPQDAVLSAIERQANLHSSEGHQ